METTYYKIGEHYLRYNRDGFSHVWGKKDPSINDLLVVLNEGSDEEFQAALDSLRTVQELPTPVDEVIIDYVRSRFPELIIRHHVATSGTEYITLWSEMEERVVIRIADHNECYLPAKDVTAQVSIYKYSTDIEAIKKIVNEVADLIIPDITDDGKE